MGKHSTVNVLKFGTHLFPFSNKMLVIRGGIHKMLVRKANRQDPGRKQSDLGLDCLSKQFWQATSFQNFRTFTVMILQFQFLLIRTKVDARGSVLAGHSLPLNSNQRQLQCTFTMYVIVDLGLISTTNICSKKYPLRQK